jgi:hypothetical protein
MLANGAEAKDVLVPVNENTDLICAGLARISGQSRWDLLACKEQLISLSAKYDLILIDSAALRQYPAASRLPILSDHVLCVLDAIDSKRDDPTFVREHLRGSTKALRFVLNKVQYEADHLFGAGEAQDRAQESASESPNKITVPGGWPRRSGALGESRRRYARHLSTLPVVCRVNGRMNGVEQELRNISYGGLSFVGKQQYAQGSILTIEFPFHNDPVELKGEVIWSREMPDAGGIEYAHGVRFLEQPEAVLANLVDQVCRIEEYRDLQRQRTGCELSAREAAEEWKKARVALPSR